MTEAVISSSVLIAVIILIRTLFKGRIKSYVRYSLWLIAAVRLMLPFEFISSPVSVMNIAEDMLPAVISEEDKSVSVTVPPESEPYIPDGVKEAAPQKNAGKISFVTVRKFITAAMLLWFTAVNTVYSASLRKNRKKFSCKYNTPVPVCTVSGISSPCIFGLFSPKIYITEKAAENDEAVKYIIAHELCHYYHGDLIWTAVRYVLLSVYWFDPFVWAAAILSKRDCECACDESAIKMLGEENRFRYGKVLIDLIPRKDLKSFGVASTSMASGLNVLKERMHFIASGSSNRIWAMAVSAAAVICAAGCTFTSAQNIKLPEIPETEELSAVNDEGRIIADVTDRNGNSCEIIYFHAPEGYEPYIYMSEYSAAKTDDRYNGENLEKFIDSAHFSAADIAFGTDEMTVSRWDNSEAFESVCNVLKNIELTEIAQPEITKSAAQLSLYRANGGFTSSLQVKIFIDGSKKTAYISGDDMSGLTEAVINNKTPDEAELAEIYGSSVHFEAAFDGGELYELLNDFIAEEETAIPEYPAFSDSCFSDNIAERLTVTGEIPAGFVKCDMGSIAFAVPYGGSINEIGSAFLWQDGSADFKMLSDMPEIPDSAEEIKGEFCGAPCYLFLSENNIFLAFSDRRENNFYASAGFSTAEEKKIALKILGSIHME